MNKILAFGSAVIIIGLFVAIPLALSGAIAPYPIAPYPAITWKDNFQSYPCNKFPSKWTLLFNGVGTSHQGVSCTVAFDGTHSLHLLGQYGWSATVARDVPLNTNTIGLSVWIQSAATSDTADYTGTVGFYWKPSSTYTWGVHIAVVGFQGNGKIIYQDAGQTIGAWTPNTWVKITIILNKATSTATVFVNDVFVGSFAAATSFPDAMSNIQSVSFEGQWANANVWFDAVEVFTL